MANLIAVELIATKIFEVRGRRVMFDADLAKLYGIETKVLNQAVKRNIDRFPSDFMFSLTRDEIERMSQFVTSYKFHKNINVFTEEGVAMLSSVLRSKKAVKVNILIMRAFVKLRGILLTHKELSVRIEKLEDKYTNHAQTIKEIFSAIKQLLKAPEDKKRIIKGFAAK